MWKVLTNNLSFVSLPQEYLHRNEYRSLKKGILSPLDMKEEGVSPGPEHLIDQYAKQYSVLKDLTITMKGFHHLDKRVE